MLTSLNALKCLLKDPSQKKFLGSVNEQRQMSVSCTGRSMQIHGVTAPRMPKMKLGNIKYQNPFFISVSSRSSVMRRMYSLSDIYFESYLWDTFVSIWISESRKSVLIFIRFMLSFISFANPFPYFFLLWVSSPDPVKFFKPGVLFSEAWLSIELLAKLTADTSRRVSFFVSVSLISSQLSGQLTLASCCSRYLRQQRYTCSTLCIRKKYTQSTPKQNNTVQPIDNQHYQVSSTICSKKMNVFDIESAQRRTIPIKTSFGDRAFIAIVLRCRQK